MAATFRRCLLLALCACSAPPAASAQEPPLPAREFRGVWIATVDNIDWPSRPGLPTAAAEAELQAIVTRAAALHLNALVFQVRPSGDAFYASDLEPWSEWLTGAQGRAPDPPWDPLQFLLERAHALGLEVHAWCNPFRARHPAARSPAAEGHVLRKLPGACVRYGDCAWMDPGDPRAAAWSLRVIDDIVTRYDVDGVHIDDYFYPYPLPGQDFPDADSYRRYRQGGGALARGDWRRANIDAFVQQLYAQTHAKKPWVAVGISPFGIARPGLPAGIEAGVDQYAGLYADVLRWQREGWCDYLSPQLYWPIDQKAQSFAVLLPWWCGQNPRNRHVWPGLDPARAAQRKPPSREHELEQQIELIRRQRFDPGQVLFSFRALARDDALVHGLRETVYREPALVPESPWLPGTDPAVHELRVEHAATGLSARWTADAGARRFAVSVQQGRTWRTLAVVGPACMQIGLPPDATRVAVRAVGRAGRTSAAAVAAIGP